MNTFKDIIKYLRIRDNLSQSELATKMNVSKSTISMYENGNREPSFEMLETIADIFNVDMNFLLGNSDVSFDSGENYYLNPETKRMAQEIYDNPSLQILFDASRDLQPDDINFVVDMINRMKWGKNDG